jgi:hypothetical protein
MRTQSNHRMLGPERVDALLEAAAATIDEHGGTFGVEYVTRLIEATRL